jgi:hypothetical protein
VTRITAERFSSEFLNDAFSDYSMPGEESKKRGVKLLELMGEAYKIEDRKQD